MAVRSVKVCPLGSIGILRVHKARDAWAAWLVTSRRTSALVFSSRRRHTRLVSDWSSDVCSSDLGQPPSSVTRRARAYGARAPAGARGPSRARRPPCRDATHRRPRSARLHRADEIRQAFPGLVRVAALERLQPRDPVDAEIAEVLAPLAPGAQRPA